MNDLAIKNTEAVYTAKRGELKALLEEAKGADGTESYDNIKSVEDPRTAMETLQTEVIDAHKSWQREKDIRDRHLEIETSRRSGRERRFEDCPSELGNRCCGR